MANQTFTKALVEELKEVAHSQDKSIADYIASNEEISDYVLSVLGDSEADAKEFNYSWEIWGRPKQQQPEEWETWLILAGRGFGKTRTGAEIVKEKVLYEGVKRIALVAPTPADARDVMVEGESGILSVFPEDQMPLYEPSKKKVTFYNTEGQKIAVALIYSGANPEALRGPQFEFAWCDEVGSWDYPEEAMDMLEFGLRLGENPQKIITTTPKPFKLICDLEDECMSEDEPNSIITRGSTYENEHNLADVFLRKIKKKYEGTRLGEQELHAKVLRETPGALWKDHMIDNNRLPADTKINFVRIVVAVDPAVTDPKKRNDKNKPDETGIIVGGIDKNGIGYVIADYTLLSSVAEWAKEIVKAYDAHLADRVIGEVNNGGDLVESNVRTVRKNISYKSVRASKAKQTRAEPISSLSEQNKIKFIGHLPKLELELTGWSPESGQKSPNRLDAFVWLFTELMLDGECGELKAIKNPLF